MSWLFLSVSTTGLGQLNAIVPIAATQSGVLYSFSTLGLINGGIESRSFAARKRRALSLLSFIKSIQYTPSLLSKWPILVAILPFVSYTHSSSIKMASFSYRWRAVDVFPGPAKKIWRPTFLNKRKTQTVLLLRSFETFGCCFSFGLFLAGWKLPVEAHQLKDFVAILNKLEGVYKKNSVSLSFFAI